MPRNGQYSTPQNEQYQMPPNGQYQMPRNGYVVKQKSNVIMNKVNGANIDGVAGELCGLRLDEEYKESELSPSSGGKQKGSGFSQRKRHLKQHFPEGADEEAKDGAGGTLIFQDSPRYKQWTTQGISVAFEEKWHPNKHQGQDDATIKFQEINEAYKGLLSPWKGILLSGPPGTGKIMLANIVATECKTTFFNISVSSIVSKWHSNSEKLERVLFQLARHHAPSTIFLDEIDAIMSHQGKAYSEHESNRQLKMELLIQVSV